MKDYREITEDLLKRRDEYVKAKKIRQKKWLAAGSSLMILTLLVLAGAKLFGNGSRITPPDETGPSALSTQTARQTEEENTIPAPGPEMPSRGEDPATSSEGTEPVVETPYVDPVDPYINPHSSSDPQETPAAATDISPSETPFSRESTSVIWSDASGSVSAALELWQGKTISYSLAEAMKEAGPEAVFAVHASVYPDGAYLINGRKLSDYEAAAEEERWVLPEKLQMLLKDGESLKYGSALLEGSTPTGEKWAPDLYAQKLAYYGEEMLAKYIVDGEFLRESVQRDLEAAQKADSAQRAYAEALHLYYKERIDAAMNELGSQSSYLLIENHGESGYLLLFVTEEQLAAVTLNPAEDWTFDLAHKEGEVTPA